MAWWLAHEILLTDEIAGLDAVLHEHLLLLQERVEEMLRAKEAAPREHVSHEAGA